MRLIDADALKGKLAERIAMAFCNGKSIEFVCNLVNEVIDNMESVSVPDGIGYRWIPVKEKLPSEFLNVLITCDRWSNITRDYVIDEIRTTQWLQDKKKFEYEVGWEHIGLRNCKPLVKAWMPMPEPYKENKNEN